MKVFEAIIHLYWGVISLIEQFPLVRLSLSLAEHSQLNIAYWLWSI